MADKNIKVYNSTNRTDGYSTEHIPSRESSDFTQSVMRIKMFHPW